MLGTALEHIDDLADFVSVSPTSYHAADQIAVRLRLAGFEEVDPARPFGDVTGRRFVLRELIAVKCRVVRKCHGPE